MYLAGVTSKAGLKVFAPIGATWIPLNWVNSSSPRISICISLPVLMFRSTVDSGATTRKGIPAACQASATLREPILFAESPFFAIRSAPIRAASMRPLRIAIAAAPSGSIRYGISDFINSHAVKREP